ncbi:MAG: MaoC/PaaZ C-terminal domain-containing protein [Thermodesulfobacteriota bacterium]
MNSTVDFSDIQQIHVSGPVSTAGLFFKGAWRSIFRSQGVLVHPQPKQLLAEMRGVQADPAKVKLYRETCGYPSHCGELPLPFPETLFNGLLGRLVTSRHFPLSPVGLIHIGQGITQYQPLHETAVFDLCCRMSGLAHTDRGIELNVAFEVRGEGDLVWDGMAYFLSRSPETLKGKRKKTGHLAEPPPAGSLRIDVPGNTGLRYAKASGDYNPHHLYPLTAKPLGYKRPIAHGMWSLARSLAEIQKEMPLPYPVSVRAEFKLPIYMPATVALNWEKNERGKRTVFKLCDARSGRPHVKGSIE